MLKLILGRAKSGKTAAIMEAVHARVLKKQGGSILLVPEQYSHEAEREMLRVCGDSLSLYAQVLSFSRLCSRVENELGGGRKPSIDKGGRLLCLVMALDAVGSRLKVFSAARRQSALQQSLLAAIDEFKTSRIGPEDVEAFAAGRSDGLGDKLADMALIYGAFNSIAARSGLDPMDALDTLADTIGKSSYGRAGYYIDGFIDFTAQQEAVIESLIRAGADVTVCLTCEGLEESHEIFEPSRRAASKLLRAAESMGAECRLETVESPESDAPLAILEKHLFSFSPVKAEPGECITLTSAAELSDECEAAAAKCLALVRSGCRWRDIAVAARGYEKYRPVLESIFRHYGIPLYSAAKSDIMDKPLSALISSAYDVICGGWEYEDVFAYLKTGLAGLSLAECDELENYVFLWSLHGSAWTRNTDWGSNPDGFGQEFTEESAEKLRRINSLRRRASGPLLRFRERAGEASTAAAQAEALAGFFRDLELSRLLDRRSRELEERGMRQAAAEYSQLWEKCVLALEQSSSVLGQTEMDCEVFGRLYCLVLSCYDVGTIPLALDRVSAGDMDRMRRRHIRHLVLLGCDSDSLPCSETGSGIFTDNDREELCSGGLDIGGTASDRLYREFALIYNCVTLPEESIHFSYCTAGEEGAQSQPSFVLSRIKSIFSMDFQMADNLLCRCSAPEPAFELAALAESPCPTPLALAAHRYFEKSGMTRELERLSGAAKLTRGRLSQDSVRALYGDRLRLSASRIDKLSSCSFSYFMQYGLKAKPRQAAAFAPPEMGTFMHFVLERVASDISENGGFSSVSGETTEALCAKYVEEYIHTRLNDFREKTPRFIYLFRRLIKDVKSVVCDMVAELAKSDFKPLDFELNFGDPRAFEPIELGSGDDRLYLTGVADRVDGWLHDGKLYIRVMDYKTGQKAFSLSDVWYGMGLQMLLYLFALEKRGRERYGHEIVPAGVMYIPARDVLVSASAKLDEGQILAEKAKKLRRSGLLLENDLVLAAMEHGDAPAYIPVKLKNGTYEGDSLATAERFGRLSRHIDGLLRKMAGELRGGSIAADPYYRSQAENACAFCDYADACHFDDRCDKIRYQTRLKPKQVWEMLEKGGEN